MVDSIERGSSWDEERNENLTTNFSPGLAEGLRLLQKALDKKWENAKLTKIDRDRVFNFQAWPVRSYQSEQQQSVQTEDLKEEVIEGAGEILES